MQVTVERDNVNDESVVVRRLHKRNGERVRADEVVLEIETSKTVTEIRAPGTGLLGIGLSEGDEIAVGGLLFEVNTGTTHMDTSARAPGPRSEQEQSVPEPRETTMDVTEAKASRAASELAQRLGLPLGNIPSRGWVTSADVLAAAVPPGAPVCAAPSKVAPRTATPNVPLRSVRTSLQKRIESRILARANGSGCTSMIGTELPLAGPRLAPPPFLFQESISDLVVFEGARLLKRYPDLNACYLDERTTGYFAEVHFGITFDTGHNLKVLALRNADKLSLSEVQSGFDTLLQLYESAAPIPDELLHLSTVTLSDLSRSGADFMLPLLNARQSLIIGITRRAAERFALHASFDHRVSEGLQVARFLDELRERVQSHYRPASMDRASALRCSVCDHSLQAEIETGGRGLLRIARADGSDGYLCRNCFEGW
jgi:2-oxoglutarate dehydrogenase E2 component (dihydrolipoamide succinyltransferase)